MLGRRPPSFKYSVRTLAVLFLPSVILLDFGGGTLQGLAALGVMLVYLLHAARLDQSCFTVLWATVLLEAIGHAGSAFYTFGFGARGLGLIVLVALQAVLVGAWFSLQFPWLPLDQPELALLFERLLFNVAPLPAASIVTWAASVAWGAEDTPAVLLAALGASYLLLGLEHPASFSESASDESSRCAPRRHRREFGAAGGDNGDGGGGGGDDGGGGGGGGGGDDDDDGVATGRPTAGDGEAAAALAACVLLLPALVHLVLHRPMLHLPSVLLRSGVPDTSRQLWLEARTLVSAGLLVVAMPSAERHGEHVRPSPLTRSLGRVRPLLLLLGGAGLVLGARAPLLEWGSLLLSLPPTYRASGALAALAGAHAAAARASAPRRRSALTVVSTIACVIGLSVLLRGVLEQATGFVIHTFFVLGVSLSTICSALVVMGALAFCAAGLTHLQVLPGVRALCLLGHAVLLALVEAVLTNEPPATPSEPPVYPPSVLLASIGAGLLLCERLAACDRFNACDRYTTGGAHAPTPPTLWWLLLAAHGGRTALLLNTGVDGGGAGGGSGGGGNGIGNGIGNGGNGGNSDVAGVDAVRLWLDGALLVGALTQVLPMRLHERRQRLAGVPKATATHGHIGGPIEGSMRVGLVIIGAARAHVSLLPPLLAPLCVGAPPGPLVVGGSLAVLASGMHLLAMQLPAPARAPAVRVCAWLLAAGVLFGALQPVPDMALLLESLIWTLVHPTASLSFGGTPRLLLWPPWALYLLCLGALAAALRLVPIGVLPPAAQLGAIGLLGAAAGLTGFGAVLPLERALFLLAAAACALGAAFLAMLVWPRALVRSARAPPALLALFLALLPIGLAAQHALLEHSAAARAYGALPRYRAAWLALYAGVCGVGALLARLLSASVIGAQSHVSTVAGVDGVVAGGVVEGGRSPRHRWLGSAVASAAASTGVGLRAEAFARQQLARRAGLDWLASVGNLCTLAAFVLLLALHVVVFDGTARGALPLAPLMLLLHPYSPPFERLHAANRYAPVVSAATLALGAAAAAEIVRRVWQAMPMHVVARGVLLAGCSVPSLTLGCRFLWGGRQRPGLLVPCCIPINSVPLLLSHARPISDLGLLGALVGAMHVAAARHARLEGLKQI